MRYLLDTHALLWWLFDDPQLTRKARKKIADPENDILVSSASAWEIATKHRLGRLPKAGDVAQRLPDYLQKARFIPLNISTAHALSAGALPRPHQDPFDRMLIAQAQLEKLTIITCDAAFRSYRVRVLW